MGNNEKKKEFFETIFWWPVKEWVQDVASSVDMHSFWLLNCVKFLWKSFFFLFALLILSFSSSLSFFFDKVFLLLPSLSSSIKSLFRWETFHLHFGWEEARNQVLSSFFLFFSQGFEGQSKVINPKERKNEQRDLFLSVHHKIYCLSLSEKNFFPTFSFFPTSGNQVWIFIPSLNFHSRFEFSFQVLSWRLAMMILKRRLKNEPNYSSVKNEFFIARKFQIWKISKL